MQYEIECTEKTYILKLKASELQYLAHIIERDNCHCERNGCTPPDDFTFEIQDLAAKEGIEYR